MIDKSLLLMYCFDAARGTFEAPFIGPDPGLDRLAPKAKRIAEIVLKNEKYFDRHDQDVVLGMIEEIAEHGDRESESTERFEAMLDFAMTLLMPAFGCLEDSRHIKFLKALRDALDDRIDSAVEPDLEIKARRSAYFCS